jgi:hypothetical protein
LHIKRNNDPHNQSLPVGVLYDEQEQEQEEEEEEGINTNMIAALF